MKPIRILFALALVAIAGCRAQEGVVAAPQSGAPPQAMADIVVVEINSLNNSIAALGNDIDASGTGLTITGVMVDQVLPPMAGAMATTDGNTVTFTPPANFTGVVTLQYAIADGNGATSSAVIAISVLAVALPPFALPDVATVLQDSGPTDIDVLANDVDFAGGGLTLTSVTVAASLPDAVHTVAIVGNQVRFTPAAGFIGAVLVDYTVTDVNGSSAIGVLTVMVSPLDLALGPVTVPDAVIVMQGSVANNIDVLANDVDPAGGGLTLTAVAVAASLPDAVHTIAIVGNQVQFTPAGGFAGSVVVTYTATDVNGNSADGVLTIVVSPLALSVGPVPLPDVATVTQDSGATDIDVLANDVDPAGGGLTVTAVAATASLPAAVHTVAIVGNQVRFTPAAGFAGIVVVTYTATDVDGNSADGLLTIMVSPLDLAVGPVTVPDAAVVLQDSGANNIDVLANDVDPAGGGLTLTAVAVAASLPDAVHTVAISGNQVQFTPAAGFAGSVVVTYTATDVNGNSADGVLTIMVSPLALPVGPVTLPDMVVVMQDSGATDIDVLANDVDPAGGGLTLTAAAATDSLPAATHTVAIVGNQVRFTPAAGFAGIVVVTYTATDVNGNTADGLLNIVVSPLALLSGPVAIPDQAVVMQDSGPNAIDVVANDVDPAGGGLTLTSVSIASSLPAAVHTVAIVGNQVQFTPAAGFAGVVVVSYVVTDVNGNTADGMLGVEVSPLPLVLGPVAAPDVAIVSSLGGAVLIDVLANDIDPAGGGLTLTAVSIDVELPAGSGSVAIVGNQVQYTPTLGYIGAVLVLYTATDVNGNTTIGELSLTVVL
jgi:hypothetical protein